LVAPGCMIIIMMNIFLFIFDLCSVVE